MSPLAWSLLATGIGAWISFIDGPQAPLIPADRLGLRTAVARGWSGPVPFAGSGRPLYFRSRRGRTMRDVPAAPGAARTG
jgi:hypothetical protein